MPVALAKTDEDIQQDVFRELRWDTRVDQTEIGVEVDNGIVTLTGTVSSYPKKLAAREAAHRVVGVLDVADDIEVELPGTPRRTDTELARAVRTTLEWDVLLPDEKIRSTVSNGWVLLEGELSTLREKEDAERVIRRLAGVKGVDNRLRIAPTLVDPARLRESIEAALERRAEREAENIHVRVEDGVVTLQGGVRTWPEKKTVLETVSHAPGVREVKDLLTLRPWD